MNFLKTMSRATKSATCAMAITFLAVSGANAQTTVINDSFANGFSDLTADGSEIAFFTTSSSMGLNEDNTVPGPIEFASGSSGRAIHGLFQEVTLAAVGDSLEMTFDFTTPASIGPFFNNEDFRWGLFSTARSTNGQADYAENIPSSSSAPNDLLRVVAGFEGEIDNLNAPGTDLGLRTHNVNAVLDSSASTSSQSPDGTPSGILMNTTGGFDFISGGEDDQITIDPNTNYTGRLFLELTDPTLATLQVTIAILDGTGAVMSTHTDDLFIDDQPNIDVDGDGDLDGEIGVNTLSFDFLGISATSGAFGSNNVIGEPDNGISISNVTITSIIGGGVVLLGDANCDGAINFDDIGPFIALLSSDDFKPEGDTNEDGEINFSDISSFISILASQS